MNEQTELTTLEPSFEIVPATTGAIEALESGAVAQQIEAAHKYPRPKVVRQITEQIMAMATVDEPTARDCFYCLPINNAGTEVVYGESIRMAEIVMYCWGNLYETATITNIDRVGRTVTAHSTVWDLERGNRKGATYVNRITIRGEHGVKLAALAALSLATRNAILRTVPKVVYKPVFERCMQIAVGSVTTLAAKREEMVKAFAPYGITLDKILARFGYEDIGQIMIDDLRKASGFLNAIKTQESTVEDLFPERPSSPSASARVESASNTGLNETAPEPKRRGRPPGSTKKAATEEHRLESPRASEESPKASDEFGEGNQSDESAEVDTQAEGLPSIVEKVRADLALINRSEASLMSRIKGWFPSQLPENAARLEDVPESLLDQVQRRWAVLKSML